MDESNVAMDENKQAQPQQQQQHVLGGDEGRPDGMTIDGKLSSLAISTTSTAPAASMFALAQHAQSLSQHTAGSFGGHNEQDADADMEACDFEE